MKARYTSECEKCLASAQRTAASIGQDYVGSEHLLLGILDNEEAYAYELLSSLGAEYDELLDLLGGEGVID